VCAYNFGCWDWISILQFYYIFSSFYGVLFALLLLLVWILVQQIQITIRLKNKIILLCIEINLKTYDKIYSFLFYTRDLLTITVHVYTQSYSCSTILSPFTQPYNLKKNAVSATLFYTSFHSHSHIFLLFFLIHTISLLFFFLTFYTIIDILFCSIYSLKARCHYQSFLCQWNLWSKTLTNFDGIELHPIFPQTLMDFDGYQPIKILFWNDEMMFTKQKHMVIKRRERGNQ
jgi:hypothetical protein